MSPTTARRPLVVGLGGTGRPGSTSEEALRYCLARSERAGAEVLVFGGDFLGGLPLYHPGHSQRSASAVELVDAFARADGVVISTPSYHGGVSAMVKNGLDYLEDLRDDPRPYLDGRAVGCVVTAAGWQAGGGTLTALRGIVHALRGWPTPLGVVLNTVEQPLTAAAVESDAARRCREQLATVGEQVVRFAVSDASGRGSDTRVGAAP